MTLFPISAWAYQLRHRRSAWPIVATVAVTTLALLVIGSLAASTLDTYQARKAYLNQVALLRLAPGETLSPAEAEQLRAAAGAALEQARVIAVETPVVVGNGYFDLLLVDGESFAGLMDAAGATLASGRLPAPGSNEVALSAALARSRNLKIGDTFGPMMGTEPDLWRPFVVAGILTGGEQIALGSRTFAGQGTAASVSQPAYLVAGITPTQAAGLKAAIARLPSQTSITLDTPETVGETMRSGTAILRKLLLFVALALSAVVAVGAVIISLLFFQRRLPELGTLAALGIARQSLLARAVSETSVLAVSGWALGALLGFGCLLLLAVGLYGPRGLSIRLLDVSALALSLLSPLLLILAALVVVFRVIRSLDPVSIVERRDL